jgi:hypothetical protein
MDDLKIVNIEVLALFCDRENHIFMPIASKKIIFLHSGTVYS